MGSPRGSPGPSSAGPALSLALLQWLSTSLPASSSSLPGELARALPVPPVRVRSRPV